MAKIRIQIIIPLIRFFKRESYPQEQIKNAIDDLYLIVKSLTISVGNRNNIPIKLRKYSKMPIKFSKFFENSFYFSDEAVLIFTCESIIDYNLIQVNQKIEGYDDLTIARELVRHEIIDNFKLVLDELFIFSHLAYPGAFKLRDGIIILDNTHIETYSTISSVIREALENTMKKNYPKIEFISLIKIYKLKRKDNISFRNEPNCSLEKALNCLTHVLNPKLDITEILMYALIGIETLYVTGEQNIQGQLNEKIQLFLGTLESYKRIIKEMYNSRSKLFHGEYHLRPFHLSESNFGIESEKIEDKLFDAFSFSTIILIATIQKMILNSKKELVFKYRLIN